MSLAAEQRASSRGSGGNNSARDAPAGRASQGSAAGGGSMWPFGGGRNATDAAADKREERRSRFSSHEAQSSQRRLQSSRPKPLGWLSRRGRQNSSSSDIPVERTSLASTGGVSVSDSMPGATPATSDDRGSPDRRGYDAVERLSDESNRATEAGLLAPLGLGRADADGNPATSGGGGSGDERASRVSAGGGAVPRPPPSPSRFRTGSKLGAPGSSLWSRRSAAAAKGGVGSGHTVSTASSSSDRESASARGGVTGSTSGGASPWAGLVGDASNKDAAGSGGASRWLRSSSAGEVSAQAVPDVPGGGGSGSGGGGSGFGAAREAVGGGGRSFFRPPSLHGAAGSERDTENASLGASVHAQAPAGTQRSPTRTVKELLSRGLNQRASEAIAGSPYPGARGAGAGFGGSDRAPSEFRAGMRANMLRQALLDSRPLDRERHLHAPTAPDGSSTLAAEPAGPAARAALADVESSSATMRGMLDLPLRTAKGRRGHRTSGEYSALIETAQKEMDNALFNCLAFVPIEVVARLHDGLDGEPGAMAPTALGAYVSEIEVAVLFSDVSGFTQLTERLQREKGGEEGAEMLNAILNGFFEQLITIVHDHDGDVIKFAGDAVLSIWSSSSGEPLEDLVCRAAACALAQLAALDFYQGGFDTTLRLHLGLGAGKGTGIDVGTAHRREFVVAGPPLDEMSTAEGIAGHGEVVVGPTVWNALLDAGVEPHGEQVDNAEEVKKHGAGFVKLRRLDRYSTPAHNRKGVPKGEWVQRMHAELLHKRSDALLHALQRYTAEPVRRHIAASSLQYSTEFREATMLFVRLTRLRFGAPDAFDKLQAAVVQIMTIVSRYEGTITRISIDDKGTVLKVTFGLPPFLHTDDPTRGVLCAMGIRDAMRILRLRACIGITTGLVFVGCVGAEHRCEYTEYGDKVNLAARYMSNAVNEVLTDEETYNKCAKTVDWDVLKPITVKGKDKPIPAYRPFQQLLPHEVEEHADAQGAERGSLAGGTLVGARAGEFVGRAVEVRMIVDALSDLIGAFDELPRSPSEPDAIGYRAAPEDERAAIDAAALIATEKRLPNELTTASAAAGPRETRPIGRDVRPRIVVLTGDTGVGKSRLVEHVSARIRQGPKRAIVLTARGSSTESSNLLFAWSAAFRKMLDAQAPPAGGAADVAAAGGVAPAGGDERVLRAQLGKLLPPRYLEHASLLNAVLGLALSTATATASMPDDIKAETTLQMLLHMLAHFAQQQPTVVVIEDCSYLDSASWQLLNAVASRVGDRGAVDTNGADSAGGALIGGAGGGAGASGGAEDGGAGAGSPPAERKPTALDEAHRRALERRKRKEAAGVTASSMSVTASRFGLTRGKELSGSHAEKKSASEQQSFLRLGRSAAVAHAPPSPAASSAAAAGASGAPHTPASVGALGGGTRVLRSSCGDRRPDGRRGSDGSSILGDSGLVPHGVRARRPSIDQSVAASAVSFPESFALIVTFQTNAGVKPPPSLTQLSALPATRAISLGPMSPAELVRIARNQLGARSLSKKAARLLGTKSAGSPFFCLELVKLLSEQGVLSIVDGIVHVSDVGRDGKSVELAVPDSVEQTIVSRIDRLERKYLMALKCASVAGNDFVDEMLRHLLPEVGIAVGEVPKIVSELCEMGLLESCAGSRYYTHSFKSALVKDVVYERLPFTQRRELHRAVAQWIEGRYRTEAELASFYPVLANHWQRAALDGEAIKYYDLCAQFALKHYANHEAVGFLNEVLKIVHACSHAERHQLGITAERHAEFASHLADASLRIGLIHEATEAIELLLTIVQMPLPSGSPSRLRALLAFEMGWAAIPLSLRARLPQSVRFRPAPPRMCELAARGYQTAARAFYFTGNVIEHDIVVLRGLEVAACVGGAQLCRSMAAAALALGRVGRLKSAFALQNKALALCEQLPDEAAEEVNKRDPTTLYCRMMFGLLSAVELCAWDVAVEMFDGTMEKALELGMMRRYEESANQKALVLFAQADLLSAELLFGKASLSAESRKDAQMYATLACSRCALMLALGQHEAATQAVEELEHLVGSRLGSSGLGPLVISICAVVAMQRMQVLGEMDSALEAAHRALAGIRALRTPSQFALFFAYTHVTHVALEAFARAPSEREQAAAAEAIGYLETFAARFRAAGPRFLLERGTLAWILERPSEAERSWREAARLAERLGMPYESTRIAWEVAVRKRDAAAEVEAVRDLADMGVNVAAFGMCVGTAKTIKRKLNRARLSTHNSDPGRSSQRASSRSQGVDGGDDSTSRGRMGGGSASAGRPGLVRAARGRTGQRHGRMATDVELIDRSLAAAERFDVSTGTAGLDWAKGHGPGAARALDAPRPDAQRRATPIPSSRLADAASDDGSSGDEAGGARGRSGSWLPSRRTAADGGRRQQQSSDKGGMMAALTRGRMPTLFANEHAGNATAAPNRPLFQTQADPADWAARSNLRSELHADGPQGDVLADDAPPASPGGVPDQVLAFGLNGSGGSTASDASAVAPRATGSASLMVAPLDTGEEEDEMPAPRRSSVLEADADGLRPIVEEARDGETSSRCSTGTHSGAGSVRVGTLRARGVR